MSMTTSATTSATTDPLAQLKSQITQALSSGGTKAIDFGTDGGQRDAAIAASSLLAGMTGALAQQPNLLAQVQPAMGKAFTGQALQDPTRLADKAWWNDVIQAVAQAAPIALQIFSAVGGGKNFAAVASSPAAQRHANDKAWQDFVADLLTQVGPILVDALRGTKDFSQAGAVTLNIQPPANIQGDPKAWWNDALSFVGDALPVVLPLLMRR